MASHEFRGENFDDIYRDLLHALSWGPQYVCSPRGQKIKENLAVTLILSNPRARLLSCQKRNTNYGFAVGEFLWYWQGKQDLETMLYYNKRMNAYSDDGKNLNSAYGFRLKDMTVGYDISPAPGARRLPLTQWEVAKRTLLSDSDSRRAVLSINEPADEVKAVTVGSKDVPCTLSLQFFVRNNRLDLHVHMRSNDVMWGLTYDLFSFTLFQECMMLELRKEEKFKDLQLGKYYHTAGSLHLYEPHFEQALEIGREYSTSIVYSMPMEPIEDLEELDKLGDIELALRKGGTSTRAVSNNLIAGLGAAAEWMGDKLLEHREKRDKEALKKNE